jgi:DnaK suppressor protein
VDGTHDALLADIPRDDALLVGRFSALSNAQEGAPVDALVETGELHFFDPESGPRDLRCRVMDVERGRELLAAERRELEHALRHRRHEDDGEEAGFQEPANLAAGLYQDELDEGLAGDLRQRLAALERAEQRLDAGTYGLSVESGEPIPDERLEAFPTAERTLEEERRLAGHTDA